MDQTLLTSLTELLLQRGLHIATAESCTLGGVASALGSHSGASAYLQGGIIAYQSDLKTSLLGVPPELIEASQIDGAGRWQTLRNVTLPMIMPSITICLFLTLANTFKMYDQNLALTNGAPAKQTQMAALSIVNTMYKKIGQEGVAQAEAVIFFLIVAAIALIQLSATRSKEVDA